MALRGLLTAATAAVILVAAGGAGALLLSGERVPDDLRSAPDPTSAATSGQEFVDERTVQTRFVISDPMPIGLRLGTGTVTATRCVPGRALASGSVAVKVDDEPVVVLHTSVPLYRDLSRGDKGRDVSSLQRELRRLGYDVSADGEFGAGTAAAVKKFHKALGFSEPEGKLVLERIVWLPERAVTPTSCALKLGDRVSAGATLASVSGRLTAVRVNTMPADLVPGTRLITVFGVTGPLGRRRAANDGAFLRKVAATPEFQAQSNAKDPATATIALAKPLSTVKVPPAAIFAQDGPRGCIQSGDLALPVVVTGSGLGASLVTLAGQPPASVNLGRAITATGCR